jgi:hypothetical protein
LKKATLLVTAVVLMVVVVFIGRLYYSEADFTLENPAWNGFSRLSGVHLQPIYNIKDLSGLGSTDTLLIVSPVSNYSAEESSSVAAYMEGGGNVIVMDDFGKANILLESIDSPVTINPTPLCEYEYYYTNHSFPIINNLNPSEEMANVSELIMNHPSSLNVSGSAYGLAQTSSRGWLDVNDNSRMDGMEKMGRYTVVARTSYGNGELLVISDPDVFINSMVELGDNQVFMGNIFSGNVWIDVGHGRSLTTVGAIYYAAKYDIIVQALLIILVVLGGFAVIRRNGIMDYIRGLVPAKPGNR